MAFATSISKKFALIAEDDALVRMAAEVILMDAGFEVYQAATGEEALSVLQDIGNDIQVLFTDVQMPPGSLSGFDLAWKCKNQWPHISIVVASGQISPKPGELPESAAFISKPFSADLVYEQLQKLLPENLQPAPLKDRSDSASRLI